MRRGERRLRSSRRQCSRSWMSTVLSVLATPMRRQKAWMASGVQPRRLRPASVGRRGTS